MTVSLTLDLILRPTRGWQRLANEGTAPNEPLLSAAGVAAVSVALTLLGGVALGTSDSVGRATLLLLAATAGYVGAAVLATHALPALLAGNDPRRRAAVARYAGAATLPALATGIAHLAPTESLRWIIALSGCALSAYSAMAGARQLQPTARPHLAAVLSTALTSASVLAVSAFRSAS